MHVTYHRTVISILVAGCITLGIGGGLYVATAASHTRTHIDRPATSTTFNGPSRPISRALLRTFAFFRHASARAAAASTSLPARIGERMLSPGGSRAQYQLDPAGAQYVVAGDFHGWVVPGQSGACLLEERPAAVLGGESLVNSVCATVANTDAGLLVMVQDPGSLQESVVGLARDGARVSATLADGTTRYLHTFDNVYSGSGAIRSLSLHGPGAVTDIPVS